MILLVVGGVIGYVAANKLIAKQPWKLSYDLVVNL